MSISIVLNPPNTVIINEVQKTILIQGQGIQGAPGSGGGSSGNIDGGNFTDSNAESIDGGTF
jgi:hypothetical protein